MWLKFNMLEMVPPGELWDRPPSALVLCQPPAPPHRLRAPEETSVLPLRPLPGIACPAGGRDAAVPQRRSNCPGRAWLTLLGISSANAKQM